MTVHARRYGRWCRVHFDIEPEPGQEHATDQAAGTVEATATAKVTDVQAEQAQAGDLPKREPGSLN